jgi:hypothetical protein
MLNYHLFTKFNHLIYILTVTFQETCIDSFENANGTLKTAIVNHLKNSTEATSNGLAITTFISDVLGSLKLRRLMSLPDRHDEQPMWLRSKDRKLLQTADLRRKANIVVAKDGSSKYRTITDALNAVPINSDHRFVIYVKKGVYYENVQVGTNKWNVVMVGDGMTSTVVSASLNAMDGTGTYQSATFGKIFVWELCYLDSMHDTYVKMHDWDLNFTNKLSKRIVYNYLFEV